MRWTEVSDRSLMIVKGFCKCDNDFVQQLNKQANIKWLTF